MASESSLALLRVLADGAFHSGASLGAQFNMTRAGIHHHIGVLREMGIIFEAVRNKGYRIPGGLPLLNAADLAQDLPEIDVYHAAILPSTQDYIVPLARQKPIRPLLCVAEYQTAGRGRGQKTWQAPYAKSLCFSLCLRLKKPMHALSGFTLALGVVLCQTLEALGAEGLQLKWPNDVYVQHKKLAGILTEAFGDLEGPTHVVVGIGLNISDVAAQGEWMDVQSCVKNALISRHTVLVCLVKNIIAACHDYECHGFEFFRDAYYQRDFLKGKKVIVQQENETIRATALGVGERGELLLDGATVSIFSGSVLLA